MGDRHASGTRVTHLDSVRGIAASVVVFYHCLLTFRPFDEVRLHGVRTPSWARIAAIPPLSLLWDGRSAVLIFFVLSGFVLALMLSGRRTTYAAFAVKRFCRIYLPYALAIAVALVLMGKLGSRHISGVSDWFNRSWSQPVTTGLIAHHALMNGQDIGVVDNPIWSLIHELRVSLIFPLLMLGVRRVRATVFLPALLLLVILRQLPFHVFQTNLMLQTSLETGSYLFLFTAGAYLAYHRVALREWLRAGDKTTKWLLAVFAAFALSAPTLVGVSPHWWLRAGLECVDQGGAVVLLVLLVGLEAPERRLNGKALVWYGGISYSLYLTHIIVLLTLVHAFGGAVPVAALIVTVPLVAIVVACGAYYFVERPAIYAGRTLSQRLDSWPGRRKQSAAAATT